MTDLGDAIGELVGHDVRLVDRKRGTAHRYNAACSCGYESSPGKSAIFAINAGRGHIKRVGDKLARELEGKDPRSSEAGQGGRVRGGVSDLPSSGWSL